MGEGPDQSPDFSYELEKTDCEVVALSAEVVVPSKLWEPHRGILVVDSRCSQPSLWGISVGSCRAFWRTDGQGTGPCLGCAVERVKVATGSDPFAIPTAPDPELCRLVDLISPEICELGLRVMKTLVPGTYPMQFDSRGPHFRGRRKTRVPVQLGLLERARSFEELRRIPHPFP